MGRILTKLQKEPNLPHTLALPAVRAAGHLPEVATKPRPRAKTSRRQVPMAWT